LARIINLLKISHTHLVLDLSKALMPTDMAGLRLADHILLLAQLELASLRNVRRIPMALGADYEVSNKARVLMHRFGRDHIEGDISLKKAEETIGKPIFWQIPNDSKAMLSSRVAGVPLLMHSPKSRAQQSICGLGQALSGKSEAVAQSPRTSGSFLKRLVGR